MEKVKKILAEKFTAIKKFLLMILMLSVVGGGIFFAYQFVMSEGEEGNSPPEKIETKKSAQEKSKAKVAMIIPENPFISNKEISAKAAEKISRKQSETVAENKSTSPPVLPTIPKTQAVSPTQQIKIPPTQVSERKIINPFTMEEMESKPDNNNVRGIITANNGKNIAIMSDGEVLSEGEKYLDGRIAYIGGDGIEMDNGKKIKLKE